MATKKVINVSLNRVEGDLDISVEIDGGVVTNAWSSGIMYRGFENILVGREALDGLVITPRICGICTTGHLTAAALALDMIAGVQPPPRTVGTPVARSPPHRPERAVFPHPVPRLYSHSRGYSQLPVTISSCYCPQ